MTKASRCLICNCEKTMPLDAQALSRATGQDIDRIYTQLCRSQLEYYETALAQSGDLTVACTQEAPLFEEVASEQGEGATPRFVNIREMAGWSEEAKKTTPKIAGLLAAAAYEPKPVRLKSITSDGLCLVYGSGQQALEIAQLLSKSLSVTLLLSDDRDFMLPSRGDIPINRGDIIRAKGSFGHFTLTVDHYAPLMPSSRGELQFIMARDGTTTTCSVILDLSGKPPFLTGHTHSDGYKRVDPGDPAAALRAVIELSDLAGEFEKPIYVDYNHEICAHARSKITGCTKCLDICPAGAITEASDNVSIDSGICAGCGSCHAVCPTGAIAYCYPRREDTLARAQLMLRTYAQAGGKTPDILLHDEKVGVEMIGALARYGRGLPANLLPIAMHAVTSVGHVEMAGLLASGARRIFVLADARLRDELDGLRSEAEFADHILSALGFGSESRIQVIEESDPDKVETALWSQTTSRAMPEGDFTPVGNKRDIARIVFARLYEGAPQKRDIIELPAHAPYGRLVMDQAACTLCMACVSACPTGAMMDTPGEPRLRFTESACVQCGLCVKTCPENALSLDPRLNFSASAMQPVTLNEEEPFSCVVCGKPFATRSTIERIRTQLAGKHAMFAGADRTRIIEMCEDCRVQAMANSADNPFSLGQRPMVRTTEDYIAARDKKLTASDFLDDDG